MAQLTDSMKRDGFNVIFTVHPEGAAFPAPRLGRSKQCVPTPIQGAGKTLLASCIAALATGQFPEVWPHTAGRDDEEVR
jgi:hypothetical protein